MAALAFVTGEAFSKELCFRFRKAIVSTSANISGQPSPANFSEISEEIKQAVDYIVGYRQDEVGHPKPSGIIKLGKRRRSEDYKRIRKREWMLLIEDKKSLLQRFILWREKKDKGKTFHSDTELSGRYFYCTGSMAPEVFGRMD